MTGTLAAKAGTTKLAQRGKGTKTCQRCGRNHPLDTWPMHARFKRPLNICNDCLAESRKAGGQKHRATRARKRAEREIAAANAAAANAPATTTTATAAPPASSVALLLAKLEGYAMGKDDPALTTLIDELRQVVVVA